MASSPCDQKKAEIIRLVQKECAAEADTAKAIYDLECIEIKENYKSKVQQACRDLKDQESKDLAEKKRVYDARMVPIKKRHAQKLAEAQHKYRSVSPAANPLPTALSEAPSSSVPAMMDVSTSSDGSDVTRHETNLRRWLADQQKGEAGQTNPTSGNNSLDDSDESSDQSDIPAVMPKITKEATTEAKFALLTAKRKRRATMESGGGNHQIDAEPNSSQSENESEHDDYSDIFFQNLPTRSSRKVLKMSKRAPAQRPASSAPPERKNGLDKDGDENTYSGTGMLSLIDHSPVLSRLQVLQQTF